MCGVVGVCARKKGVCAEGPDPGSRCVGRQEGREGGRVGRGK